MQPELSTPKEVAIQANIADGTADREVGEEPAAEAVVAGMDDSPEMIARRDDREPLNLPVKWGV
jgi:hypothetical protein